MTNEQLKAIRDAAEKGIQALHDVATPEPSKWIVNMHPATVIALLDEIESLRKRYADSQVAIQLALDALGPEPPECCGCQEEWRIAIDALKGVLK